jgi:hypothetical protein
METSVNRVGAGNSNGWRYEPSSKPAASEVTPPAPALPPPTVELAAWFDRNGDGRIDSTSTVNGGDAYLRVDRSVSEALDRRTVRPRDRLALVNEAAVNSYRKYGANGPIKDRSPH